MGAQLEFWFDFASTYSYLSAVRIEKAAAAKEVTVSWQPFLLGPIFAEQGWNNSPFNIYPAKGRYMWRDMQRLCAARDLPLQRPDPFPAHSIKAARAALTVDEPAKRGAFVRAVYEAQFGSGRDISDDAVLTECLEASGVSAQLLACTKDADIKQALFDQVDRAKSRDIFGAPSFVVQDELFWGDDRLDAAISYASSI